jgi:hypothetical protein
MANVLETLSVKLEADTKGFTDGLETAKSKMSSFGSIAQGALMGLGLGAFNAVAGAAQAAVGYLGEAVDAASNMGETTSKVGVIFGEASASVLSWSENAATAFGQSKQQALDAAANFAIFGKSAGLTGEDLVKFSTDFTGLASDLASFNNTSPQQAIEAIGAALRGEAEPLRAYGVLLDDATMRQKALELGIISTTKDALTPQQKILAAQALIYEQTSLAQGDFARTSDGLANQQRILNAEWENMQTTLGQALLPVTLAFTQGLNQLIQVVMPPLSALLNNSVIPAMTSLGETVSSLIDYFGVFLEEGDSVNDYLADLPAPMQGVARFIADNLIPAFQTLADLFADTIGPILETARGWFDQFGETVSGMVDRNLNFFQGWITQNMPRIQQIVETVLGAISAFWEQHGQTITNVVQTFLGFVTMLWDTQFRTILNIVQVALQLLTGDFQGAGQTLQSILNDWRIFFENVIRTITDGIRQWFQEVDWGGIGYAILQGIAGGIQAGASMIANAAQQAAQAALDAAKNLLGINSPSKLAADEIGAPFAQGIGVGITDALSRVSGQVAASLDGMMGGLTAGITPAGAGARAGGDIHLVQNFYGPADAATVRGAAQEGIRAELRAAGRR